LEPCHSTGILFFCNVNGSVISGTAYPQRGKLIFEGDGIAEIVDEEENDATAIIVKGGGGSVDISNYVSNCILKMPNGGIALSGNTITLSPGIEILIPNGRNGDGTFQNVPFTLESSINSTGQFVNAGYGIVFLKDDGTAINRENNRFIISTEDPEPNFYGIWYNPETNTSNECSGGVPISQFMGAPVAEYHNGGSYLPESVTPYGVVAIDNGITFRYWEDV
jgi:hypothetical protein